MVCLDVILCLPALCGLSLSISRILLVTQLQKQGQIGSSMDQSPLEWITDANGVSLWRVRSVRMGQGQSLLWGSDGPRVMSIAY